MSTMLQDIRYGFRLLRAQPVFSAVAVATLALGLGATTALFSVIDAAILRPLPYPNPEQLVTIYNIDPSKPEARYMPSVTDMTAWREQLPGVFTQLATWKNETVVSLQGAEPERLAVMRVNADYLPLHGVLPMTGRPFATADMRLDAPPVVLLGHAYWQRQFNGDRGVVGRLITFAGESAAIVGVLPPIPGSTTPVWRPLQLTDGAAQAGQFRVFGRLRAGVSLEQAQREMNALAARTEPGSGVVLQSMSSYTTQEYWTTLRILAAAVAFVLAIACVNVAGLQLARGAARRHELAVRAAIGAAPGRLFRQLLTESLTLAGVAGALGVFLAWATLEFLVANIPLTLRSDVPVQLDLRVLVFGLAITVVAGVSFGLVPAIRLSGARVGAVLARTPRAHGSAISRRTGQALVAAEVAMALVLLAGAGLMLRSLTRIYAVDLGFQPSSILTMEVTPVDARPAAYQQFYPALLERVRAVSGVVAAGAIDTLPLGGSVRFGMVNVDGKTQGIEIRQILPGYFEAMGLSLVAGRFLRDGDSAGAVVINERAARTLFGDPRPVGRRFGRKLESEVVGVVASVRHMGPQEPIEPEMYQLAAGGTSSYAGQAQGRPLTIVVRPAAGVAQASGLAEQLRERAQSTGQRAIVRRIRTGDDWFGWWTTTARQRTVLIGLLGSLGATLALVGILGVTAYAVARRTREIGVRMAFGATAGRVVRSIVGETALPVLAGVLLGVLGAALSTRLIEAFLFETSPTDPASFAAAAATLGGLACVAAWLPARRAARVNPIEALRED